MTDELTNITNALVPISEEQGLVAKVDPRIASEITYNKKRILSGDRSIKESYAGQNPTRVSDLFMSRYGIMAYVEYSITGEVIGGILEVPKTLALILQAAMGDDAYRRFVEENFGWYINDHEENLNIPQLKGSRFIDKKYLWGVKPDYRGVGAVMKDDADEISTELKNTLRTVDATIDAVFGRETPKDGTETYQRLQNSGFLLRA